jgi:coenzyme F420-0:L-glutamate ligase/coenzyme F420-1:gamma-L-glutamate ligase
MALTFAPLPQMPLICPGDNLTDMLLASLQTARITLEDGDILVVAQKIVSKAEERLVNLTTISPSKEALELAKRSEKDPRLVELILRESKEVLRVRPGTIIVVHRLGFVCASAGIDHSNVRGQDGNPEDWMLLLPENPDHSALEIRRKIKVATGNRIGVMIIDSHGRLAAGHDWHSNWHFRSPRSGGRTRLAGPVWLSAQGHHRRRSRRTGCGCLSRHGRGC